MSGYWQRLFAPRDRELANAGAEGELLVARARLVMTAVILIVPLMILVEDPAQRENWIGLAAAAVTVLVSVAVLVAVSRGWRPYWLGFVTSLYDVTVISCVLATFLVVGPPHMAVNSRTTFEVYFLAIAATVRNDRDHVQRRRRRRRGRRRWSGGTPDVRRPAPARGQERRSQPDHRRIRPDAGTALATIRSCRSPAFRDRRAHDSPS